MLRLGSLALLLSLSACSSPIVGFWESDSKLGNGQRNELDIFDDNTVEAEIYATTCKECEDWVKFKFEGDWEEFDLEFELDLECQEGNCDGADFKMDCEVIEEEGSGEEKMDCKGDGLWENYAFDWQRNEE